jgi:hypothetical protein
MEYWRIAPGERGFLWAEQRDANCIAVGWNWAGDLNKYETDEERKDAFYRLTPKTKKKRKRSPNQLLRFYHHVKPEDKVLASSGKWIYGAGTVVTEYDFAPELYYKHSRGVEWESKLWAPISVEEAGLSYRVAKRLRRCQLTIMKLEEIEWEEVHHALSKRSGQFDRRPHYEGLLRGPQTEQEVIALFCKLNQHLGMRIYSMGTRFPDAYVKVRRHRKWITAPVEFELNSLDFKAHGHLKQMDRNEGCYVVCWNDNWRGRKPRKLTVVELRTELRKKLSREA